MREESVWNHRGSRTRVGRNQRLLENRDALLLAALGARTNHWRFELVTRGLKYASVISPYPFPCHWPYSLPPSSSFWHYRVVLFALRKILPVLKFCHSPLHSSPSYYTLPAYSFRFLFAHPAECPTPMEWPLPWLRISTLPTCSWLRTDTVTERDWNHLIGESVQGGLELGHSLYEG